MLAHNSDPSSATEVSDAVKDVIRRLEDNGSEFSDSLVTSTEQGPQTSEAPSRATEPEVIDHKMNAMETAMQTKSITAIAIVVGLGIAVNLLRRHRHNRSKKNA